MLGQWVKYQFRNPKILLILQKKTILYSMELFFYVSNQRMVGKGNHGDDILFVYFQDH